MHQIGCWNIRIPFLLCNEIAVQMISISAHCSLELLKKSEEVPWQIYCFQQFTRHSQGWRWTFNGKLLKLHILFHMKSWKLCADICRDFLNKQANTQQNKSLKYFLQIFIHQRWLIRCRRRVETKVSSSLLWKSEYTSKHPSDNVISAAASHFSFSSFWLKADAHKQNRKAHKDLPKYLRFDAISCCTYQSFSENLQCKCFRDGFEDKIFIIWAASLRFSFQLRFYSSHINLQQNLK